MNISQNAPQWSRKAITEFKSKALPATVEVRQGRPDDYSRIEHEANEVGFFFGSLEKYDEGIHDRAKGQPGVVQLEDAVVSYYQRQEGGLEVLSVFGQPGQEPNGAWYAFIGDKHSSDQSLHLSRIDVDGQPAARVRAATSQNGDYLQGTVMEGWTLAN